MKVKNMTNLTIDGELVIHSQDGELIITGEAGREEGKVSGQARVERGEGQTIIRGEGSLVLTLPAATPVSIRGPVTSLVLKGLEEVRVEECHGSFVARELAHLHVEEELHGDVVLRHLSGDLHLNDIHGDLAVHASRNVRVENVHGDCVLHQVGEVYLGNVEGELSVSGASEVRLSHVAGDAALANLTGSATLEKIGGTLSVSAPGPSLAALDVAGDAALAGTLTPGGEYNIRAGGDIRTGVHGNIHFVVRAGGEVDIAEGMEQEHDGDALHVYLGPRENAAHVFLEAEGDVYLNTRRHRHRHHHRHEYHRGPRIHIDAEVESALRSARKEMREAQRQIRREMKRFRKNFRYEFERALHESNGVEDLGESIGEAVRTTVHELLSALRPAGPAAPPSPPPAPSSSAAPSDELKMILNMVQEGTLSPEEAEKLIEALD